MRGCRAPELANGDFQRMLRDLSATTASQLLANLQRELSEESRVTLLQDFKRGRQQFLFVQLAFGPLEASTLVCVWMRA